MFIWLVAPCGISLLPAANENFLPILQEAPIPDLYSTQAEMLKARDGSDNT